MRGVIGFDLVGRAIVEHFGGWLFVMSLLVVCVFG